MSSDMSSDVSSDASDNASGDESGTENDTSTDTPTPVQTIVYKYRDANINDELVASNGSADYVENGITIIGVETVSENGVYIIPEVIDGKRVVAIYEWAFCEEHIKDSVRVVVVPKNVRNIHNFAFAKCYNMTDLYLRGESVAGSHYYWLAKKELQNETVTIHCSATCHDRNLRKHKNEILYSYEGFAKYEEWNSLE
jgi:hypothetical protein